MSHKTLAFTDKRDGGTAVYGLAEGRLLSADQDPSAFAYAGPSFVLSGRRGAKGLELECRSDDWETVAWNSTISDSGRSVEPSLEPPWPSFGKGPTPSWNESAFYVPVRVAGNEGKRIVSVSRANGSTNWISQEEGIELFAVGDQVLGALFLGDDGLEVAALDLDSGKTVWRTQLGSTKASTPRISGRLIAVAARGENSILVMHVYGGPKGQVSASIRLHPDCPRSMAVEQDSTMYMAAPEGLLEVTSNTTRRISGDLLVGGTDDCILVDDPLRAYDPADRHELWRLETVRLGTGTALKVPDESEFVIHVDGEIRWISSIDGRTLRIASAPNGEIQFQAARSRAVLVRTEGAWHVLRARDSRTDELAVRAKLGALAKRRMNEISAESSAQIETSRSKPA